MLIKEPQTQRQAATRATKFIARGHIHHLIQPDTKFTSATGPTTTDILAVDTAAPAYADAATNPITHAATHPTADAANSQTAPAANSSTAHAATSSTVDAATSSTANATTS